MGILKAIADLKCKLDNKRYTGFAQSFGGEFATWGADRSIRVMGVNCSNA